MTLSPYLTFDGRCEEALTFYAETLGARIVAMMPHEGTPMEEHVPPEWKAKILHAQLAIGEQTLMASDVPPERYERPKGITVSLGLTDVGEAERIFNALAEGGTVQMPIQPTYWAARFGMLMDRFGIPWLVNCDQTA